MSSPNQLTFEILIKTILDGRGIEAGDAQIKNYAASLVATAQAGKPVATSADEIAKAFQKSGESGKFATDKFGELQYSLEDQAALSLLYAGNTEKMTDATTAAGEAAGHSGRAFMGFKEIIGGIEFNRPAEALRGIVNLTGAAGIGLSTLGSILGATAIAGGPLLVLYLALKSAANENDAAMQRVWSQAAAHAKAYQDALAKITEAAKKDLAEQLAAVQRLSSAYSDLQHDIDRAAQNSDKINEANKQLELAKATTPEQKAEIEARYAAAANDSAGTRASVREKAANETLAASRTQQEEAAAKVRDAQRKYDDAVAASKDVRDNTAANAKPEVSGTGVLTDFLGNSLLSARDQVAGNVAAKRSLDASERAKEAKAALDAAEANAKEINDRLAPTQQAAQDALDNARTDRTVAGIQRQTLAVTTAQKVVATPSADPNRRAELLQIAAAASRSAEEHQATGNFTAQGQDQIAFKAANDEMKRMSSAANSLAKSAVEHGATTTAALTTATAAFTISAKNNKKQKEQLNNQRDSGAAGN